MIVKVLGPGCANCHKLEALAVRGIGELGLDAEIVKVSDYPEIMAYGVMSTPALVIDEKLVLAGRLPSYAEVLTLLGRAATGGGI